MKIDFAKASFKDFENPFGMDAYQRATYFNEFLDFLQERGHLNYRLEGLTGRGPVVDLDIPGYGGRRSYVSLVSNDYLRFTQHPLVKKAAIYGITNLVLAPVPLPQLEDISVTIRRLRMSYTSNSASLLAMLQIEDVAILDMGVHTSVGEGCQGTNVKTFLHNNMDSLERALKQSQHNYRTKFVVIKKDSRIRMSLMATHTRAQLDTVLNAFEHVSKKLDLATVRQV